MTSVHELAQYHLDRARQCIRIAAGCTATSELKAHWRHSRAYWQHLAAFHRQEFRRLARECHRLDAHRLAYGREHRTL